MPRSNDSKTSDFGRHKSPGSLFLSKEQDIERELSLLPYAHYLRQAWSELNLSGVLCVDGRPTVYLCEGTHFTAAQKIEGHRFVWNQGLVPLLVFLTSNQVEVHSAVKKPEQATPSGQLFEQDMSSLIPMLGNITEALECARLVRSIETGQFFQEHAEFFPANETVDRCLVDDLVHTALRLKAKGWDLTRAHALLGRVLFVSFLHERKFIKPHHFPHGTTCLLDILNRPTVIEKKRLLYREFFPLLKQEFNGTMFDTALAAEERDIDQVHLNILVDFLSGHRITERQKTLAFWAYDFRFIPVETISAIYEEFMKDSDLKKKRNEGAYYTPRHLAETTLHVALEGRYAEVAHWRVLDPACGSGIFLVAMFNLLAEKWLRENSVRRKQTKAQALLDILQGQIRGVDLNPDACRITAFSLYLALFEKLQPIDVDEFKSKVRHHGFLPPLVWDPDATEPKPDNAVVIRGDFLKDDLPLEKNHNLVIGNPPWESRGDKQVALHFARHSREFLCGNGIGCLLLPTTILVNRHGTLDGDWFRSVTVEKIVQLADFRRVLFNATHACFILRYRKARPKLDHAIAYETPKLNRFDRRRGVIVVEPDDQKHFLQHDVLEAAIQEKLQSLWLREFWGTSRDAAFLRRLDFLPKLADIVAGLNPREGWTNGVGFQPYFPGHYNGEPEPLGEWKLTDRYLPNTRVFPQLIVFQNSLTSLKKGLEATRHRKSKVPASLTELRRKPPEKLFTPPLVLYSKGFTKSAFCGRKVRFQDGLRSICGPPENEDELRFLAAVLTSDLFKYITFHSGSSLGIGRDQLHVHESLNLPFPLPGDELAPSNADELINAGAAILRDLEGAGQDKDSQKRRELIGAARRKLEPIVDAYFCVSPDERILIDDTLKIFQKSIHRSNIDADIATLEFPKYPDRKRYADTLCEVLNRRARKESIQIHAQGMASESLNLVFFTVFFAGKPKPYDEIGGDIELWDALALASQAAQRDNGSFSYLRGFNYFEPDRLHILKPATMRNWCRTAALNDADAVFEHLSKREA